MPSRRLPVPVLLSLLLPALLAACSTTWVVTRPAPPGLLGPEVDSVVVRSFAADDGIALNEADVGLFGLQLREVLGTRPQLRTFDDPPTRLPNTVLLDGRLDAYEASEESDDGLVLRTLRLTVTVAVHASAPVRGRKEPPPLAVVTRSVDWRKLYPGATVSALPLDLAHAAEEIAGQIVQALVPAPAGEDIRLYDGRDPATGRVQAHDALIKGNRFAVVRLYDKARQAWRRVLFDPTTGDPSERRYQISTQTLNQLRLAGLDSSDWAPVQALLGEAPRALVPFRQRLRELAGRPLENEGLVLTLADAYAAYAHLNLSAAHANLALVDSMERRRDTAAYHFAAAWAHNPAPALLVRWADLQRKRGVYPPGLDEADAARLYLRLPPPRTALVRPGGFARAVLPPPAFGAADAAASTEPVAPAPAPAVAPDEAPTQQSAVPQPVARPPATAPTPSSGATGGGPSGPGTVPVTAPATRQ